MTSRALTIGLPVHRRRALGVGGEAAALRQVGALREAGAIITALRHPPAPLRRTLT